MTLSVGRSDPNLRNASIRYNCALQDDFKEYVCQEQGEENLVSWWSLRIYVLIVQVLFMVSKFIYVLVHSLLVSMYSLANN